MAPADELSLSIHERLRASLKRRQALNRPSSPTSSHQDQASRETFESKPAKSQSEYQTMQQIDTTLDPAFDPTFVTPSSILHTQIIHALCNPHIIARLPMSSLTLLKHIHGQSDIPPVTNLHVNDWNLRNIEVYLEDLERDGVLELRRVGVHGKERDVVVAVDSVRAAMRLSSMPTSREGAEHPADTKNDSQLAPRSQSPQEGPVLTWDVAPKLPGLEEANAVLATPTAREAIRDGMCEDIYSLIRKPTARWRLIAEKFKGQEDVPFRDFCPWRLRDECLNHHPQGYRCDKLHFRRILQPQTDPSLGDCSYLNTCHRMDVCKYIHYELDEVGGVIDIQRAIPVSRVGNPHPAQWIRCDVRTFDFSVAGKFSVIMADPPWDIHMNLPYGTMTDDEMRAMPISALQDDGFIFLWVTGRAMELGRECLRIWGYQRIDELIWVKIMQLQKLIRTGRTGHWLNHSKEHCLVGIKGRPRYHNVGIDTDVLVAEVRETSRKPDEVYGIIDRLCPGSRKIEIFGRMHNTRDGWLTLGNQLDGVRISEEDMLERFRKRYPETPVTLYTQPE